MSRTLSLRRFVPLSLLLLLTSSSLAQSPRELIEQGNAEFTRGDYESALETYKRVDEKVDPTIQAELLNNLAAANFKLGKIEDARELWVRAASMKDEAFESAARYNLGDCDYADALKAVEAQNAQGALELLDRAMQQYRDAIRLDPQRADARANLELAAQLKKQIEEQAEQQPQSQPSQEQQDNEQQQDEKNQSSSQPSSQPSDSDQQKDEQDQSDSKDQQEQDEQSKDQQQQDPNQQQQPETQPAPESQPAPQQDDTEQQPQEQQPQPAVPIEMTREQAERLLQQIRDAERERRAILRARETSKHKPVDKDW